MTQSVMIRVSHLGSLVSSWGEQGASQGQTTGRRPPHELQGCAHCANLVVLPLSQLHSAQAWGARAVNDMRGCEPPAPPPIDDGLALLKTSLLRTRYESQKSKAALTGLGGDKRG